MSWCCNRHHFQTNAHLERAALHERGELFAAHGTGLPLLTRTQRPRRALCGYLTSIRGLHTLFAENMAASGTHGSVQYHVASAAVALGQGPSNLQHQQTGERAKSMQCLACEYKCNVASADGGDTTHNPLDARANARNHRARCIHASAAFRFACSASPRKKSQTIAMLLYQCQQHASLSCPLSTVSLSQSRTRPIPPILPSSATDTSLLGLSSQPFIPANHTTGTTRY